MIHDQEQVTQEELQPSTENNNIHESNETEKLEQQIIELKDQLNRARAETENVRNRYERLITDAKEFAIKSFAKDIISVLDNFARAFQQYPQDLNESVQSFLDGIKITLGELERNLAKHGVTKFVPQAGEDFDYNIHEALAKIATDKYPAGKVVDIIQVGYKLNDRLLRSAVVSVSQSHDN